MPSDPDETMRTLVKARRLLESIELDHLGEEADGRIMSALEDLDNAILDGLDTLYCEPAENDECDLRTDGGVSRRGLLGAAVGALALGALPAGAAADGSDDGGVVVEPEDPELRRDRGLKGSVETHAIVDLPPEVWERAQEHTAPDEPLMESVVDYLRPEFGIIVDGELVHTTEGFDRLGVAPNDAAMDVLNGEPVIDRADVSGEGEHGGE